MKNLYYAASPRDEMPNNFQSHNESAMSTRRDLRPLFIDVIKEERFHLCTSISKANPLNPVYLPEYRFQDADGELKDYLYELNIDAEDVDISFVTRQILEIQRNFKPAQYQKVETCFLWRSASFLLSACCALPALKFRYNPEMPEKCKLSEDIFDIFGVGLLNYPTLTVFKESSFRVDIFRLITIICYIYKENLSTPDLTELSARRFFDWLLQGRTECTSLADVFNAFDEFSCWGYRGNKNTIAAREDLQLINYLCAFYLALCLSTPGIEHLKRHSF